MRREAVEAWMGALIACPLLGWVAWCEPLIWPLAFLFWGMTAWFLADKIKGWMK